MGNTEKSSKIEYGSKIEVDNETLEPKIVKVSLSEIERDTNVSAPTVILNGKEMTTDKMTEKEYVEYGKQMVMKQFIGVNPNEETDEKKKRLKKFASVIFMIIVVAVLLWTGYNDFFSPEARANPPQWTEIKSAISENWYYSLCAIVALGCCLIIKGLKLSLLCKKMTGKFRFKTCFETGIIGHYYNNVTPLAVGGQPFEIYHMATHGIHGGVASSLPILAYLTSQFGFVLLGLFSLIIFTPSTNILSIPEEIITSTTATVIRPLAYIGLALGLIMPLLVMLCCIMPRVCSKLVCLVIKIGAKFKLIKDEKRTTYKTLKTVLHNTKCLKSILKNPLHFLISLVLSMAETLALCSIAYFTLRFFGFDNPNAWHIWEWSQVCTVCVILYAGVSFIPTPGNMGAADLSFYWLFKVGLLSVAGLSFPAMLLWRILSYYSFVIIGFVFVTLKHKSDRRKEREGKSLYRE